MGSNDEVDSIEHTEVVDDSMAEYPAGASGIPFPCIDVFWIGPHEVRHGPFVWDLLFPVDESHLVDCR